MVWVGMVVVIMSWNSLACFNESHHFMLWESS